MKDVADFGDTMPANLECLKIVETARVELVKETRVLCVSHYRLLQRMLARLGLAVDKEDQLGPS